MAAVPASVDVTPTVVGSATVNVLNIENQSRRRTNRPRRRRRRQTNSWPVGTSVTKEFGDVYNKRVYVGSVVSVKPATESEQQL